jgi:hypothetical protein
VQKLRWYDPIVQAVTTNLPLLTDPFATVILTPPGESPLPQFETVGKTPAFKTSTGFEVRFLHAGAERAVQVIGATTRRAAACWGTTCRLPRSSLPVRGRHHVLSVVASDVALPNL